MTTLSPIVRERTLAKARTLLEALPFIREHRGRTIVIKYGGAAMDHTPLSRSFAEDLALLANVGLEPVVVHGGGPQITEVAERMGLRARFVDGLRVTDQATLEVATMVLAGRVNTGIVATLQACGVRATGLSGVDGAAVLARRRTEPDLGFVGEVVRTDPTIVRTVLDAGYVPVVASIAADEEGQPLNLNADVVAAELAVGLEAAKLVYVNDVAGVIGPDGDLRSELSVEETLDLLATPGAVAGGMIPKLESAVRAVKGGVPRVHLLDGRIEHSLVLELFTPEGIGTMITAGAGTSSTAEEAGR